MKSMKTPLRMVGPLLLLAAGSAWAGPVVTAKVPFAFEVQDKVLPAGEYTVERSDEDPAVLIIKGDHGVHAMAITSSVTASGADPAGEQASLVFTRGMHGYRLKDVWEDREDGQEIPTSR